MELDADPIVTTHLHESDDVHPVTAAGMFTVTTVLFSSSVKSVLPTSPTSPERVLGDRLRCSTATTSARSGLLHRKTS
ncbi:hypothetical protein ACFV9E_08380 [Streptomyces sp. NPDC059835]|uniref:hypothetical protein n=1 Tax=Streptomyces sp. NPDC059835 TaxID=3346967 RepID=UPI00364C40E3